MRKLPYGSSGVSLALFVMSQAYFVAHLRVIGIITFFIGIVFLVGTLFTWSANVKELFFKIIKENELGGTLPTLGMGIMVFTSILFHFFHFNFLICYSILWIGIILYILLSVVFWIYQIKNFSIKNITPTWYIPTIGSLVIAISGYNFDVLIFSVGLTYFGILSFIVITTLLIVKVVKEGFSLPKWQGSISICAAPASLIVLSSERFSFLYIVSIVFIVISLIILVWIYFLLSKILKTPFSISMASITFPIGISVVAIERSIFHVHMIKYKIFLISIAGIEMAIATFVIYYVTVGYIFYIFRKAKNEEKI